MSQPQQKARTFSVIEAYVVAYKASLSMNKLRAARNENLMSKQFTERIMLAVTQVNQCEVCSYAHTKMALEANMSNTEIEAMLGGINDYVPTDELAGVMFAQHVAESKNHPSKEAWDQVITIYGESTAYGILAAARIMMMGNAYGIAYSSFLNRFKKNTPSQTSLFYEVSMLLASILMTPFAMIQGQLARLLHVKVISFT
jgi:AhpD family alkylhydroperoxidase